MDGIASSSPFPMFVVNLQIAFDSVRMKTGAVFLDLVNNKTQLKNIRVNLNHTLHNVN